MDFKAKLALLGKPPAAPLNEEPALAPQVSPLTALIPPVTTPRGPLHATLSRSKAPSAVKVETLTAFGLSPDWRHVDPARLLFLDTETTGLSGGTGTIPFLVGLAWVEGGELVVEQLHLPAPGQEGPMLDRLHERVTAASALVSFNGRSFDWPLLRNRFVLTRVKPPPPRLHLDLLHVGRRVLRHWQKETRLQVVEKAVLGHERVGDLDGAQVPTAWFDYLRTGRVATLARVLEHNLQDLRSTAGFLSWLSEAWSGQGPVPPEVSLGLAELAEKAGDPERAEAWAKAATESLVAEPRARAWTALARLLRGRGALRAAARALEEATACAENAAPLHLALSRLYEHRLHDGPSAQRHAALARPAEDEGTHARRVRRLEKKRQLVLAME